jgi:hypothetical protein
MLEIAGRSLKSTSGPDWEVPISEPAAVAIDDFDAAVAVGVMMTQMTTMTAHHSVHPVGAAATTMTTSMMIGTTWQSGGLLQIRSLERVEDFGGEASGGSETSESHKEGETACSRWQDCGGFRW